MKAAKAEEEEQLKELDVEQGIVTEPSEVRSRFPRRPMRQTNYALHGHGCTLQSDTHQHSPLVQEWHEL